MNDYEIEKYSGESLDYSLELAEHTIYRHYLNELTMYPAAEPSHNLTAEKTENNTAFCKVSKFVRRSGEDILQKLVTVYNATMALGSSLIIMIDVNKKDAPANIYMGVRSRSEKDLRTSLLTLKREMKSNFAGTVLEDVSSKSDMPKLVGDIFDGKNVKNISSVSCTAALRDKSGTEDKKFIQGIEYFIDAMQGSVYTAIFIAEPVSAEEQAQMRYGYEELYNSLSVFRKNILSYSESESNTVMQSISHSISNSITESTSHTNAHTKAKGGNLGINLGAGSGRSDTISSSKPTNFARAGTAISTLGGMLKKIPHPACNIIGMVAEGAGSLMQGESVGQALGKSISGSFGIHAGGHLDVSDTTSDTNGTAKTHGEQNTKTSGSQDTKGTSRTIQIEKTNKHIEEMLDRIDESLKRIHETEDYGAYQCGAYFLSGKPETCRLAANTYRALMLGDGSSVENSAVNLWSDETAVENMKEYLRRFTHPVFGIPYADMSSKTLQFMEVSAGTVVSGMELPLHLGLPTKSVYGLPVVEHAEFGRNIATVNPEKNDDKIKIGKIYHMGQREDVDVRLNIQELAAHTFITGSTGAGKSNTIYQILDKLSEKNIPFLVIEPAKGEYKKLFSGKNIRIYGTNPNFKDIEMLKLNPFSFPEDIHILEHLERLTEIFNACWAMYAAMPAILKSAVQRAYESTGWDTEKSINKYGYRIFPDFSDVHREIKKVLKESDYSADNKNDYTGALVTRIESLTNGISGLVFKSNGLSDEELFDRNAIIDLSRIGSAETKSLIMGIFILKLQEYRMNNLRQPNAPLNHVTVLEEAHHLLKKINVNQTDESSNLQGKAVEMLTNSIAEMRTCGEGFIIADQSPALLDMSVIRNTNTKIIMHLLEQSDCELTGYAAGLNDFQVGEIARLERGIAIVRQSEWIQPVLCKITRYTPCETDKTPTEIHEVKNDAEIKLLDCIVKNPKQENIRELEKQVMSSDLSTRIKCGFMRYIQEENISTANEYFESLVYDFLDGEKSMQCVQKYYPDGNSLESACMKIIRSFRYSMKNYSESEKNKILLHVIKEHLRRYDSCTDFIQDFLKN